MQSLIQDITHLLQQALALVDSNLAQEVPVVTPATSEKFGHYQCNSAMKLGKIRGESPRDFAQKWVEALPAETPFEKIEIAGPGFINLHLKPSYLEKRLKPLVSDSRLGIPEPEQKKRVIVDFSSPNIAKEMHVGHLRSTIIGESISRLFEFLGWDVLRLNHVGDWGTAFGMLIAYMKKEVPQVLEHKQVATLSDLMEWYRLSKKRFDEDEAFKTEARLSVVSLQDGDPFALEAWKLICQISREAFQKVYDVLDVSLEERGESFYNPFLAPLIEDLQKRDLVTESEGAKCLFFEGYKIPFMVQKSDGGYNYDTTDLAALKYRIQEDKADRLIYVVDAGQGLHFKLLKEAGIAAGYLDPKKVEYDHVAFGLVLGEDGKKFRTRSGDVVRLSDLLKTAVSKAYEILSTREHDMDDNELHELAQVLGIDAIKYADLSCNRLQDYTFSYDRMLRFEGNTAAFILYANVRVHGIKRKLGIESISEIAKEAQISLKHDSEVDLALQLARFHETLEVFAKELYPHVMTEYLYQLAQKFNIFFRDCKVVGSEEQNERLLLCECVANVMEKGLYLLGLKTVERM
jgi:arginyl-tRNA synthetase